MPFTLILQEEEEEQKYIWFFVIKHKLMKLFVVALIKHVFFLSLYFNYNLYIYLVKCVHSFRY